jgi:Prophage antirepressor
MGSQSQEHLKLPFEQQNVRLLNDGGEIWFVLVDVCQILEIGNTGDVLARLDDDEKAEIDIVDVSSNGVEQRRTFSLVNESGLYSLILRRRKPQAKRFRKWVTAQVLPSIRRTGRYDAGQQSKADAPVEFTPAQKMHLMRAENQAL